MKISLTYQSESSECGLACLANALAYFGHQTDLVEMRRLAGSSGRGMSLRMLLSAADIFGLDARPVKLDAIEARSLPKASILHWDSDHFVVFMGYRLGYYSIIDPVFGFKNLSGKDFSRSFTGIAVELAPNSRFQIRKYRAAPIVSKLIRSIPRIKSSLSKLVVYSLALEVISLIYPLLTQVIIDEVVVTRDDGLLMGVVGAVVALAVIQLGLSSARADFAIRFKQDSSNRLKINILRHLIDLPLEWFMKRQPGDLQNRFNGINTIQNSFTTTVTQNVLDGFMAVFTGVMVVFYGGWIGLIACLSVIADIFIKAGVYARYRSINVSTAKLDSDLQSHFLETVRNIACIKMTSLAVSRVRTWSNKNIQLSNARVKQQRIDIFSNNFQECMAGFDRAIVLYLAGTAVINNAMTIGVLVAFISYKDQTDRRISSLTSALFSLRALSVQSERLRDILESPKETGSSSGLKLTHNPGKPLEAIYLNEVSKKFSSNGLWVFKHLTAVIKPGSRVFITGPSGCGKTTLLKVIIGLDEASGGTVSSDSVGFIKANIGVYRSLFSGVMQDDSLFTGTIIENITCFDPNPDFERLERCIFAVDFHRDIQRMPMGLHTHLNGFNSTLSGGQRQRVQLARVLYLDTPIIFLDEATNQLDSQSEAAILNTIYATGKTVIVVTHKKSLYRNSTMEFTFHEGNIIVSGAMIATKK